MTSILLNLIQSQVRVAPQHFQEPTQKVVGFFIGGSTVQSLIFFGSIIRFTQSNLGIIVL